MFKKGPRSQLDIMRVCALVHLEQHVHFPPLLVLPLVNLPFTPFAHNVGHAHGLPTHYSASAPHHEKTKHGQTILGDGNICQLYEKRIFHKIKNKWGGGEKGVREQMKRKLNTDHNWV